MQVKRISPEDTYSIRQQVLREGRPIEDCKFALDHDDHSFHLGAFVNNQLTSVASFMMESNPAIDSNPQYRLRGMATLPDYRKQGLSKALLQTAFPIIKQNLCDVVWCNAREQAIGFYESVGFIPIGTMFPLQISARTYSCIKLFNLVFAHRS